MPDFCKFTFGLNWNIIGSGHYGAYLCFKGFGKKNEIISEKGEKVVNQCVTGLMGFQVPVSTACWMMCPNLST